MGMNTEYELILAVYFDGNADDKKVHVRNPFFTVCKLVSGDAKGIIQSIEQGMHYMGNRMGDNWAQKLIGFGTDGAAVNLAEGGLKGQLKQVAPWMEMVWCLAHRLELALKDALKNTCFSSIGEMLLLVYFWYENPQRSVGELEGVIEELAGCLAPTDMPMRGAKLTTYNKKNLQSAN